MRTKLNRCSRATRTLSLLLVSTAAVIGFSAVPASAQSTTSTGTCVQDEYNSLNGTNKTLSCTASDVTTAGIVPGSESVIGGSGDKCLATSQFNFVATFEILTTSNKTRSNIGVYFGTGQSNAISGTCSDEILAPQHPCPGDPNKQCGNLYNSYEELDTSINGEPACTGASTDTACGCGDSSSTDDKTPLLSGYQEAVFEVDNVTCPLSAPPCPASAGEPAGTDCMALPVCTSWWQPTSTMPECLTSYSAYSWRPQAVPGTSSKCSCNTLYIPIQPITPSITVAKSCNTTTSTRSNLTSCDEGYGDVTSNNVTYHVTVTNTSNIGGIIIDQICDNVYGTIYRSASFTGASCPTGSIGGSGSLISTTCTSSVPGDIAFGASESCDFVAHQNENLSETDTVSVYAHSDEQTTAPIAISPNPTTSNTVTVTSEDSPTTASTTKGLAGTEADCVTARYNVTVSNTSSADESISLSGLTDSVYGDISSLHSSGTAGTPGYVAVTGTTCGQPVPSGSTPGGIGTLSAANGAGNFPSSVAPSGTYTCQFDGEFCQAVSSAAEEYGTGACSGSSSVPGTCTNPGGITPGGGCTTNAQCDLTCAGISQTDTVNATLTSDETGVSVTQTVTGLNVTECVASFTSAH